MSESVNQWSVNQYGSDSEGQGWFTVYRDAMHGDAFRLKICVKRVNNVCDSVHIYIYICTIVHIYVFFMYIYMA